MDDTVTRKLHNWKCTSGKMGWVSHKYQASVVPFGAVHMTMISVCYSTRWVDDRNASALKRFCISNNEYDIRDSITQHPHPA
jgi:hypothetical protein